MGYGVDFRGLFEIDPPLNSETYDKLQNLISKEHMRYELDRYNTITLDDGIRYHTYIYDLKLLIEVLALNNYKLNGEMSFSEHEDQRDSGVIEVKDNTMEIYGHYYKKGNSWTPEGGTDDETEEDETEEEINLLRRESPDISTSSSTTSNKVNLGYSEIFEVIKSTTLTENEIASIILLLNKKLSNLEKT